MAETSLSPKSARAIRDRARQISAPELAGPRDLRRRFLAEARARVGRRASPTLVVLALTCAASATAEGFAARPSIGGALAAGGAAVAVAAGAALLRIARRSLAALATVVASAALAGLVGLGALCLATGAGASHHAAVLPAAYVGLLVVLALPVRATAALALAGGVVTVAGTLGASPVAQGLVAGAAALSIVLSRQRERRALAAFVKTERLSATLRRFSALQEELVVVEKLEALRVLVGGIAHELNNALAVAQVAVDAARADPSRAALLLEKAQGGLGRIKRTVERLRRFALASEGRLEPADVGAMLDFALESAIGRARSGVLVDRDYDPHVGALDCRVAELAEALFQISRNAVEAMPGGGTLKARVRADGDSVVLSVEDEGRGIPAENLARVFDPYFSRDKGAGEIYTTLGGSKARGGSGLGLSTVYGIVSAMGGRVKIRSAEGQGTEVAIFLPRSRPSRPPSPP